MRGQDGFTLIEIVCVLAIISLLAALALPMFPRDTPRARLEGYALQIAAMLKGDRTAAMREGKPVSTAIDADALAIRSGRTGERLQLPADVGFKALIAKSCAGRRAGASIDFFPTGMSCGARRQSGDDFAGGLCFGQAPFGGETGAKSAVGQLADRRDGDHRDRQGGQRLDQRETGGAARIIV